MTEKVPEIEMNAVVRHVLAIVVVAIVSLSLPARAAAQAAFASTPSSVSFGNFPVGETTPTVFVEIQNVGTQPGSIGAYALMRTSDGFAIEPPLLPISVAPGGSVLFGVTFTPQAAGPHLAQLVISTDSDLIPQILNLLPAQALANAIRRWRSRPEAGRSHLALSRCSKALAA